MATITVDKFELLPGPSPAEGPAAAASDRTPAASPPPSRHELHRIWRLELSRLARVRAH